MSINSEVKHKRDITLRTKINWLVTLDVLIVLILVLAVFSYFLIKTHYNEEGQKALSVARVVASMPAVIKALDDSDPSLTIQPIAERVRQQTGASYIYVASMGLRNYSSPNSNEIGKVLTGDNYQRVLLGESSTTQYESPSGLTVRAKAPIVGSDHGQRGIVAVSFVIADLWSETLYYLTIIIMVGVVGLAIGLLGAYLLSGHVKKQIFNLEPKEIALLSQEQIAILEAIREGVVAVDIEGKINACNQEAKRLLSIEQSDNVIGKNITDVIPNSRLPEILMSGTTHLDQPMVLGNNLVIVNRIPVLHKGKVIGAVSTFRDKMQLEQIDHRLADIGHYVDDLRSQRHEFMNRLHTIAGLIKIKDYDLAANLIDQVNVEQQQVLDFFLTRIRDSAVVGILLGKVHHANELGIQLNIDPHTRLNEQCSHRELVVTILGNAIENSFQAITEWAHRPRVPIVTVYISDEGESLIVQVTDNGPGIKPEIRASVLEDGVSTKGENHGFGLTLISRRINKINGTLHIDSSENGTTLRAVLPK